MSQRYFNSPQRPVPGKNDEATRIFNEALDIVSHFQEYGYSYEDIVNIAHMVITVARSRKKETGAR